MKSKGFSLLIIILLVFYAIAISFWLIFHAIFYLYNFTIIGTCLGLGLGLWPVLPKKKKHIARKVSQMLVGGYMFFGLGLGLIYIAFGKLSPENMQLEGFWFWLLNGSFAAAVMHYTIAKIIGPFIFNRAWCGWTCWTAAVLDFLPWNKGAGRVKKWGSARYALFFASTLTVFILVFVFHYTLNSTRGIVDLTGLETGGRYYSNYWLIPELWWFLAGNILYFGVGVLLAIAKRDNRAFCKYVCPVTVSLKIGSRASLLKVSGERDKCTDCKLCEKNCPMDIHITEYVKNDTRVTSSECILCFTCVNSCAKKALRVNFGFDMGAKDLLNYTNPLR